MKKVFYRVYSHDYFAQFGRYEWANKKIWKENEEFSIPEGLYATPHIHCVANMLAWHNDLAFEREGGHISNSYVLLIETKEGDYYHPQPTKCFNKKVDEDEVLIRKGKIVKIYNRQQDFVDDYNIVVEGMYSWLRLTPSANKK